MKKSFSGYRDYPVSAESEQTRFYFSKTDYFFGLAVILGAVFSQYFFNLGGFYSSLAVIYGLPIIVITILSGQNILRRAFKNNKKALAYGLAAWGISLLAAYIVDLFIFNFLANFDPHSLLPLNNSNPLPYSSASPWVMIILSFAVIGPSEEYIFRGFVFGGALRAFPKRHWFLLAILSSAVFSIAHFYYFLTFGAASGIIIPDIFAVGLALAAAYYYSGGNLLVPVFFHGLFDALGFLSSATGTNLGDNLRFFLVGIGIITALFLLAKSLLWPHRRLSDTPAV